MICSEFGRGRWARSARYFSNRFRRPAVSVLDVSVPGALASCVVTDERGCESCFGLFKFPERIVGINGNILAATGLDGRWWFRDFVDSPDPRYRQIVQCFADAGYTAFVKDEFA